jgi:hypothetical protein
MKKKTILTGILRFLLVVMMTLAGCDTGSNDSGGKTQDPPQTPAAPTTGTLILHNATSLPNDTLIKVEIWEGTSASGTAKETYTTPISSGGTKEWTLVPGAYYVRATDNQHYTHSKVANVKVGETTDVIYTGYALN